MTLLSSFFNIVTAKSIGEQKFRVNVCGMLESGVDIPYCGDMSGVLYAQEIVLLLPRVVVSLTTAISSNNYLNLFLT